MFGLLHGFIKIYALFTWNVTSWGSRPDADIDDNERMTPAALPSEVMQTPSKEKKGLPRYDDEATVASDDEISNPAPAYDQDEPPSYEDDNIPSTTQSTTDITT